MDSENFGTVVVKSIIAGTVAVGVYYLVFKLQLFKSKTRFDIDIDEIISDLKSNAEKTCQKVEKHLEAANDLVDSHVSTVVEHAKNMIIPKEMQDALESISTLLEKLKEFDMEAVPYESPFFLLIALLKHIQEENGAGGTENCVCHLTREQVYSIRRIGNYSLDVYPASWTFSRAAAAKAMHIDEEDILLTHFKDKEGAHCPKFIIFKDIIEEAIVLAIRGTFSFKDVITDVICGEEKFLDGFAHRGILEGSAQILAIAKEEINKALIKNPKYKLIVTGHSLGAGAAELIYLQLKLGDQQYIPQGTEVQCYALAPPPVVRAMQDFPEEITKHMSIIVFNNDLVPRISLANFASLLTKLRKLDELKIPIYSLISIITNHKSEEDETILRKVRKTLREIVQQDVFPYLEHPGRVIHIKKDKGRIRALLEESVSFADSLLFLENMVMDHLQPSYREALDSI